MNLRKHLGLLAALVFAVSLAGTAQTQDAPVTVTDTTIADLTNDATVFHGQTVRLQGTIANFLSPNMFILAEDALIAQDGVLVINNTGIPLPNLLIEGRAVSVTGFVHPSYDVVFADPAQRLPSFFDVMGGVVSMPGMMPQVDPATMPTIDPAMMPTLDPAIPTVDPALIPAGQPPTGVMTPMSLPYVWDDALAAVYNGGYLPDGFRFYTIIELRDGSQIAVTPVTQ